MTLYSVSDFLLDRANIHDTVTKFYLLFDRHQWDKFDTVIAPTLLLDYTAMFGGEPSNVSPSELAETWKSFAAKFTSHQHVITALVIDLPQPGNSDGKVTTASVEANVIAYLVRDGFEGGDKTSNGGRLEAEVTKISDDPAIGNRWRISKWKANPLWVAGNPKVLHD